MVSRSAFVTAFEVSEAVDSVKNILGNDVAATIREQPLSKAIESLKTFSLGLPNKSSTLTRLQNVIVFLMKYERSYDRHPPRPVRNFAIPSKHEVIPIYHTVQSSLLEELRTSQTDFSLSLFLRGRELEFAQPTIFIICGDPDSFVTRTEIPSAFRLFITGGRNMRAVDDMNFSNVMDPYHYEKPNCGCSIGSTNESEGCCTFGGYLKDSNNGEIFGMTCFHLFDLTKTPNGTTVFQPSKQDYDALLERLQRNILDGRQEVETKPWLMKDIERYGAEFEVLSGKRSSLPFGIFFDGKMTETVDRGERRAEDWALFTPEKDRLGVNLQPLREKAQLTWGGYIRGVVDIDTDLEVYKYGRSSGASWGKVNGVKTSVKLPGSKCDTSEWVVVNVDLHRSFSTGGDSGAWVTDKYGQLVGYVIGGGGSSSGKDGLTYVSPIKFVLECIERKTGRNLEPVCNTEAANILYFSYKPGEAPKVPWHM
ncbi:hypothetical protein BC832DRAFT_591690 [Gaertneriomyces semiglobifer]|nr:hypothetical protein BC832DRAFT_591690 [Gaertneriomyces semiglobifer]